MSNIQIIDNFLSELNFLNIKNTILNNSNFLWQFNPDRIRSNYNEFNHDEKLPFQFVHGIYRNFCPTSEHFNTIKPLINKIKPRSLIRIKINLTTKSENIIESGFHVDQSFDHKVGIFYVNTNDGYTLFENGEKIESIENRMILFDGSLKHAGTNCTNKQRRVVINFNYL